MIKNNGSEKNEAEEIEAWRNEHGNPDLPYLRSLATTGSEESLYKLKAIAEDFDVDLDPGASADDIIDRIQMAVKSNEDGNSNNTN